MSVITKDLGIASAYGYAKSKGYTGTEEEFAELMASYADVAQQAEAAAQDAEDAKDEAVTAKTDAQTAKTAAQAAQSAAETASGTATTKASEAAQSAQSAAGSASAAQTSATAASGSASTAQTAAQTATNKASEASSSASAASTAKTGAETARTGAQTAQTAAETAQANAEAAAASVSASAAQIEQNTEDIAELKNDFAQLDSLFTAPPDNLFTHPHHYAEGQFTSPEGSSASNASWGYVDILGLTSGEKLSLAGGRHITCFFQENAPVAGSIIEGGADVTTNEVRTIPEGANGVRISFLLANKDQMAVVVSDTIVTVADIAETKYTPSAELDVYSKTIVDALICGKVTSVRVGTDYANLRIALEDIATKELSYKNRYIVYLPAGTYDIKSLFTNTELETTKGLFVPPFTKIVGLGNPSSVMLNWINEETNSTQAVLNLDCTAELENLTLHGEKLRYAVHDDWTVRKWDGTTPYAEYWLDAFANRSWFRTIRNCIFEVVDSPVRPAWGAGVVNGSRWLFEDCTFISNKAYTISCHNNTGFTLGSDIVFRNCKFTSPSAEGRFGRFTTISTGANGIINNVKFIGCNDTGASKLALIEEDVSRFGTGCLWNVNGNSNTFDNTDIQIVVTDGNDYSDRKNLV